MEQIEFWTFGCKNGTVHICFDKNERFIEVTQKDLRTMVMWMSMDLNTYDPIYSENYYHKRRILFLCFYIV